MRLWRYTQSLHSFNLQYRPALLRHQQGYESCLYLQVNLCQLTVATVELTQVVLLSYLISSYPVWLAILTVCLLTNLWHSLHQAQKPPGTSHRARGKGFLVQLLCVRLSKSLLLLLLPCHWVMVSLPGC